MNKFDIPDMLNLMGNLSGLEAFYDSLKIVGKGGTPQTGDQLKRPIAIIEGLRTFFNYHGMPDCEQSANSAIGQLSQILTDVSAAAAILLSFRESVIRNLKRRQFVLVPEERSEYLDHPHLFGEQVSYAFPLAKNDISQAGNCLAVECCTACVFHLMRVVEHGIRALANDRDVNISKGPIELATWEQLIKELEKSEAAIQQYPKTLAREAQLNFYHGAMIEVRAFKNKFRNSVMHTRDEYDLHEAMSAFTHVRTFMQVLSEKISDHSRTPTVWT